MRILVLMLSVFVVSAAVAEDRAKSPIAALRNAREAAKSGEWPALASTMTEECQRVLTVDINGLFILAADAARRQGVAESRIEEFAREYETAQNEWIASGTTLTIVKAVAEELGRTDYRASLVNADRLAKFATKFEMPVATSEERLECRIGLHTLELLVGKRWEEITDNDAEVSNQAFSEERIATLFEKAAQRVDSRFEEITTTMPNLLVVNLISKPQEARSQKCKLAGMYAPLAEILPDAVRLCRLIDVEFEPVLITAGRVNEFVVDGEAATAPVTVNLAGRVCRQDLQFKQVKGEWKIDSLGYGRWLECRFARPTEALESVVPVRKESNHRKESELPR